jgi:glycine/D-amino acid oxidase-like deaminating enzyme
MNYDFIIVGQGISGTFLSYYLQKEKKSFLLIDNNEQTSPSRIGSGIINPVTGRRMVTVWMAEEVLPFAWNAYQEIGKELNITAIAHKNILDFFPNPFMRENFLQRVNEGNQYIHPYPEQNHFNTFFNYEFGCGEIRPVYIVNNELLLPAWRDVLKNQQLLLEENFDINSLKVHADHVDYKNIRADKIIFCDGVAGFQNPFFKQLPFAPNKGEALIVEIPGLPDHNIYKKSMILAPLNEKDIFWVGSNYLWDFDNTDPTESFRKNTEQVLKDWLKIPFKVIEHKAGVRPATLERRPFAGMHPHYANVGILNGMGTKGYSLAPFFARQLTDHLLYEEMITPEASVHRFQRILSQKLI